MQNIPFKPELPTTPETQTKLSAIDQIYNGLRAALTDDTLRQPGHDGNIQFTNSQRETVVATVMHDLALSASRSAEQALADLWQGKKTVITLVNQTTGTSTHLLGPGMPLTQELKATTRLTKADDDINRQTVAIEKPETGLPKQVSLESSPDLQAVVASLRIDLADMPNESQTGSDALTVPELPNTAEELFVKLSGFLGSFEPQINGHTYYSWNDPSGAELEMHDYAHSPGRPKTALDTGTAPICIENHTTGHTSYVTRRGLLPNIFSKIQASTNNIENNGNPEEVLIVRVSPDEVKLVSIKEIEDAPEVMAALRHIQNASDRMYSNPRIGATGRAALSGYSTTPTPGR